jgi:hypothetical protein
MAPLLVAGALTFRRGMIVLTSTLNGLILSAFVPIGFMAIPIYADGTPVLDIKPYVPQFDAIEAERIGWLKDRVNRVNDTKDDARFHGKP